jgi:hypothetical protein
LVEAAHGIPFCLKFEPEKMPNEYARAVHELVQEVETPKVVNIMDAPKKSMQAKGQTKVRDSVRKRMGKATPKDQISTASPR